jgi:hypothetical protein
MVHANKPDLSEELLASLSGFLRTIHVNAHTDEYADKGAHKLLAYLSATGVQRLSDLPKDIPLDLSTISRHCATNAGREYLERVRVEKTALLKDATSRWSVEDIEDFIRLLDRMAKDLEKFAKTERISDRPESKS